MVRELGDSPPVPTLLRVVVHTARSSQVHALFQTDPVGELGVSLLRIPLVLAGGVPQVVAITALAGLGQRERQHAEVPGMHEPSVLPVDVDAHQRQRTHDEREGPSSVIVAIDDRVFPEGELLVLPDESLGLVSLTRAPQGPPRIRRAVLPRPHQGYARWSGM